MLENCAQGYEMKDHPHNRAILYNGRTFPSLPKYREIEIGHVKKLVQVLRLDADCVTQHLPALKNLLPKAEKDGVTDCRGR